MTNVSDANEAQATYWNGEEAAHWVTSENGYDRMLEPFGAAMLDVAALAPDARVLDIGCGTGPTTCDAAAIAVDGQARGIDISRQMIEAAGQRAARLGLTNATFAVGDAQTDPFAPETDVVISRFGVMFFADALAAFTNLHTALASGGRLVFVCWQSLFSNEWMALPGLAAAQHVPLPEPGPEDAPGPFSLGDPDRVRTLLTSAGFSGITIDPFETSILLGGGGTLEDATGFMARTGMARALFADAAPDAVARAMEAVTVALDEHMTPEGVRLSSATWLVSASK